MNRQSDVTVREALELDVFRNSRVLGGHSGLDNVIKSVNVMESPDIIHWVKPNELLITVAYALRNDMYALAELIPILSAKKLAGLAVKPKLYIDAIPQEMIEKADEYGFPLIELPPNISLADVMDPVWLNIVSRESLLIEQNRQMNERFMNIVLSGGRLDAIVKELATLIGNPVLIQNRDGFSTIFSSPDPEVLSPNCIDEQEWEKVKEIKNLPGIGIKKDGLVSIYQPKNGSEIYKLVFNIYAGTILYGHLNIWTCSKMLTQKDIMVVENAVNAIALQLILLTSVRETELKYRNEVLRGLLFGDFTDDESMIKRARLVGWNLASEYVVILIYPELDRKARTGVNNIPNLCDRIIDFIQRFVDKPVIVGEINSDIVLLFPLKNSRGPVDNEVRKWLNCIISSCSQKIQIPLYATFGRYHQGLKGVSKSYRDAAKALSVLRYKRQPGVPVAFSDLGIERLLFELIETNEIHDFWQETMKPLVDYDKTKGTELIKTLSVFFKHNGNLKKVADEMFAHYNTVLYRIGKIQKLTNLCLESSNDRLLLNVGLAVHNLISATTTCPEKKEEA